MEYSTQDLIHLAYAAYRINGDYVKHTKRYSEGQSTTFSNKELITFTAHSEWQPEDFVALTVTDEDRKAKIAGDKHMRRYTMLAMGDLPDFEANLFSAYSSERMPITRAGMLAYLPAFIDRQVADKLYKQRLKTDFADSKHLKSFEPTEVEILRVIPLSSDFYDKAYMHFGAVGKDLVCFTVKQAYSVGETYNIVAKIKKEDAERETGAPMTRLNYVKLRKQEI